MFLDRALLKFLLARRNSKHLRSGKPRLVGFAFDQITLKIHLDGRFEDAELTALEQLVFPKLPKSGVCLDIGANIGNHSVVFAGHFSKIHAFEPNPNVFKALSINASLRDNITVWNLGCSDKAAELDVVENPMNLGSTGIGIGGGRIAGETVRFQVLPLDEHEFLAPNDKLAFVKIDVEGHEAEVIRGASRLLARDLPVVAIEIHRNKIANGSNDTLEALYALGYKHLYEVTRRRGLAHLNPFWRTAVVPVPQLAQRSYSMLLVSATPFI
ncbi:FkbM family methyltransferase [Tabrizicola sp.]|uniref:FkbM family methyltransferase n=1 Tax=Tabrizicola sp. TaxID=2005166 RepID=UPI003D2D164F